METGKKSKTIMAACLTALLLVFGFCLSGCTTSKAKGISLNVYDAEIEVGQTLSIEADVKVRNSYMFGGAVEWSSSDEDVATVQSGYVYGKSRGVAVITAKVKNETAECEVRVTEGTLKVGIKDDVKDFGYEDKFQGAYTGMEIELAGMLASGLLYTDVEFVVTQGDARIDSLNDGTVDCVIATFSRTPERQVLVNFVDIPYYVDYIQVLAKNDYFKETGMTGLADIPEYLMNETYVTKEDKTCVIGTVEGTTARDELRTYYALSDITQNDTMNNAGRDLFEYVEYHSYEEASEALEAGEIDLFMGDYSILRNYKAKDMSFTDDKFGEQDYCVATRKTADSGDEGAGDDGTSEEFILHDEIEKLIREWTTDGTMAELLEKYGLSEGAYIYAETEEE